MKKQNQIELDVSSGARLHWQLQKRLLENVPLCCQESHHGTGLYLTLTSFLCWDFSAQKAKKNAALKRIRTSCYLDFQNTPLEELNVSVKA